MEISTDFWKRGDAETMKAQLSRFCYSHLMLVMPTSVWLFFQNHIVMGAIMSVYTIANIIILVSYNKYQQEKMKNESTARANTRSN